jgi:hypothetical protein
MRPDTSDLVASSDYCDSRRRAGRKAPVGNDLGERDMMKSGLDWLDRHAPQMIWVTLLVFGIAILGYYLVR